MRHFLFVLLVRPSAWWFWAFVLQLVLASTALAAFNQPVQGVSTNTSAAAGFVGEELNASATAVSLVSTTAKTIATLSLTAGDWDVEATVKFNYASTSTSTWRAAGISLTTNVMPTTLADTTALSIQSGAVTIGLTGPALPTGSARASLASTTNIFCVAQSTFAISTATADCFIRARRIR